MTADPEIVRLGQEAAAAIAEADIPRLEALIKEVEARAAIDALSRAALTPWPPHE